MANKETLKEFENIYNETYKDISLYVVCQVKHCQDVEDILQTIYMHVYKVLKKKKAISKSYLLGIAKHKIKDYYRFRYKDKIVSYFEKKEIEENWVKDEIDIEKSTNLKWETERVWEDLKKKKVIVFQIFYLYYVADLTLKEIANHLNITESNVKHYLYRTLKELKEKYKEE